MRWNKKAKRKPLMHDIRYKVFFAFIPIRIHSEVRWLETVFVKQEYTGLYWRNVAFLDENKKERKKLIL